ncbi:MAG: phosphatase PAP2 family protein [Acidobacteriota bacterium]|nr:phosphatase PAP2 family protein [Acidobacteriota bacterium]
MSTLRGLAVLAFCLTPLLAQDNRDTIYYPGDTENIKPLGRKLLSNILLDQKAIWTSPFHLDREDAEWFAGLGAVTAALVITDRRTTHILENSNGQVQYGNNISKIGAVYSVLPEVAGFYLYGVLADNQKARETGVLGGEALLDGLIVMEVLKTAAGRNRPNDAKEPGNFFDGGSSFPSGHSIETWALASVISHEYSNRKWVPYVAYGLASVVGVSRVAARQHYASDVFAGAAMGYFIGRYVVNTHEAHAGHHHASLAPILQPSTRTFGLDVKLR